MAIRRSALEPIGTVAVAASFGPAGSASAASAVTVAFRIAGRGGSTVVTTFALTLPVGASGPAQEHVTVRGRWRRRRPRCALTNWTVAGSGSVSVTALASDGPSFTAPTA